MTSFVLQALAELAVKTLGLSGDSVSVQEVQQAAARLARDRGSLDAKVLNVFCETFVKLYRNYDYDIDSNGERWLLRRLAGLPMRIVFDVGANHGEWTRTARQEVAHCDIHAFEIVPETFRQLDAATAGPGIFLNAVGLGAADGAMPIRVFEAGSELSSMVDFPHGASREVTCQVRTGDGYLKERGIGYVDLLKIDVEGAEHLVLQGFEQALARGAVAVIQFEYGKTSILTRYLLRDYYRHLTDRGFVVGKLFPDHVDFRAYELDDEDFLGPNYVACRADRPDILERLRKA
jgi:FkbM family methyltransferase